MKWLRKLLLLSVIPVLALLAGTEGALRLAKFSYQPREKVLSNPVVSSFIRTLEIYYPTVFDPPGYMWVRRDRIASEAPDGTRTYTWPVEKRPGVKRVAFLGGSTSEDIYLHPYPRRTVTLLNEAAGGEAFEALNVGCSGYNTHQSLIALDRYVLPRNPDVVVVYHGWNDVRFTQAGDGYCDREKDFLLPGKRFAEQGARQRLAGLNRFRIVQLVGKTMDVMDRTWPRPRITEPDLERNYREIVRRCRERGIPVVIVVKPDADHPPLGMPEIREQTIREYRKRFGPGLEAVYQGMDRIAVGVQRKIAREEPGVRLADAHAYFKSMPEPAGPSPDLAATVLFLQDAMHNTEIGKERLAQVVAPEVAPELGDRIRSHIRTADYWQRRAEELRDALFPYQAVYAAGLALSADPSRKEAIEDLVRRAERDYEFYRLFQAGRWGGSGQFGWREKLDMLKKCLEIKPDDFGVCLQIFRVCIYMERIALAAEEMKGFQPANLRDRLEYLQLCFLSHTQAQRWGLAEMTARDILKINPAHPDARQFIQYVDQQRTMRNARPLL